MITGKEDMLQALIEAYIMEKGTNNFYIQAAVKARNEEAKKTFGELSAWEGRHMEYIQFLYQSIQGDRDMFSFEEFKKRIPAPLVEGAIPVKDLEEKLEDYTFVDDLGALILALEIEGKACSLYRKLSESAEDSNAGVIFKDMMEQEQMHIDYLRDMRLKLAETS